jgi:lysozyme family protein
MTSKTTFELAVDFTLRKDIEGGYTVDTGGPTNRGITLTTLREADRLGIVDGDFNKDGTIDEKDIRLLPEAVAVLIYKSLYWNPFDFDTSPIDPRLAICVFDTAVNCGVARADDWLTAVERVGAGYSYYLNLRIAHYLGLIKRNPTKYGKYKMGWLRRVNELKKYVSDPDVVTS